jgi:glycosyltransferase involved in cell wall biosynthesis
LDFASPIPDNPAMFPSADNCGALIPCHDEAATVGTVAGLLQKLALRVIVVDDGSQDASAAVAADAGAQVVRHPRRLGKGAALATGWAAAAAVQWEWVLMLDADGQHAPEDAPTLLAAAGPDVPLVIGNRWGGAASMPWLRRTANRWLSDHVAKLAGVPLPDSQCGYRLAHLHTLLRLGLATRHFEIESEMCVAFARAGHQIAFVPVTTRYGAERSKISPWLDSWRWWRWYRRSRRSLATSVVGIPRGTTPALDSIAR